MKIEHFQILSAMIAAGAVCEKDDGYTIYSIQNSQGLLHSEILPAQIYIQANHFSIYWIRNGIAHREGGPAYIDNDSEAWILNGLYHRIDGPALIFHRPDVTFAGIKEVWYTNGKIHREGDPAKTYFNDKIPPEYWINGNRIQGAKC